jgi:excisionase family DNA binding protein
MQAAHEFLTIQEVARVLKVTTRRAYKLCRNGLLPHVRLGRQIRVDPDQLNQWIAKGGSALPGGWRRGPAV